MDDEDYMRIALTLAEKGIGWTSPNPMVGALIVKDGQIIGQGFHEKYGQAHAERNALSNCSQSPKGATLYVTLEPCCHYGKQPPCTEAIITSGIKRVVIGSADPNPLVSGKGVQILREHGVQVTENVLHQECNRVNGVFLHYMKTRHPLVVMKYAMTLDGKIAAYTGASQWITGEESRAYVQKQRHRYRAIMVGVGTVLADDPLLTCRLSGGRNPLRIICDSHLRTPFSAQVVTTAKEIPTILATCCSDKSRYTPYTQMGGHILPIPEQNNQVDLVKLMEKLGQAQIDSILLEGGGTLNWSALNSGIVQKVQAYIAPKLFGGQSAKTPIEGMGVASPAEAFFLTKPTIIPLGDDFLLESEVDYHVHRHC